MSEIIVNLATRSVALPTSVRRKIGNALHAMGDFFQGGIPLDRIFEILEANDVIPVDIDGTRWSGLLCGGAEVGTDKCIQHQHASFRLAYRRTKNAESVKHTLVADEPNQVEFEVVPVTQGLHLTWGRMPAPSTRWEVIKYVN